jgi:peroxiredoxin
MAKALAIGDIAPNFDLSSTEDVLLMLRDEAPRTAVLLYLFSPDADGQLERCKADLQTLSRSRDELQKLQAKSMAISPQKISILKDLQQELGLSFPLLRDDRKFSAAYGVVTPDEGIAQPALVVVDRSQKVIWLSNPVESVAEAMPTITKLIKALPASTAQYPRSIINRLVNLWVN